jgi:hypothetical protein
MLELIAPECARSNDCQFTAYVRTGEECVRPFAFKFIQELCNSCVSLGRATRQCVVRARTGGSVPNFDYRAGHPAGPVALQRKNAGVSCCPFLLTCQRNVGVHHASK